MDNEVSGTGNMYDYGFRIYNPRVGRFLSVDPLTSSYPWYTPYQFAGNKPIVFIDLDGLEEAKYDGPGSNIGYAKEALNMNVKTKRFVERLTKVPEGNETPAELANIEEERNQARLELKNAKTVVTIYTIGAATAPVAFATSYFSLTSEAIFVTSFERMGVNALIDFGNQMFVYGMDIKKVDWANVAASGVINNKFLKNFVSSAIDLTIEENGFSDSKTLEDKTMEFLIRTGADALFNSANSVINKYSPETVIPKTDKVSTNFNKASQDLMKKMVRKSIKELYKEHNPDSEIKPEN